MTERIYYQDAYCTQFEAQVVEQQVADKRLGVILDRTAFYPIGGGQPHDTGVLGGAPVLEVVERGADQAVVHWLAADASLPGGRVTAEVDWQRRFDHMQQHTGQHILSQAFVQVAGADTVGFHMSGSYSTIDLNSGTLTDGDISRAEALANQVVFEDRPVIVQFATAQEVARLPLRKPPAVHTSIRIVQIEGFDWSACGGTHISRTGAVGSVKVVRQERRGAETRLTFLCGRRALAHYGTLLTLTSNIARSLSVGVDELALTVERVQNEARLEHKEKERLQQSLLDYEAAALAAERQPLGSRSIVAKVFEGRSLEEVRQLANRIVLRPGYVVLAAVKGDKAQLIFARSPELGHDMRGLLKQVCQRVGGGGGGSPALAQGGGADPMRLDEALQVAVNLLRREMEEVNAAGQG
jgi:alanyl-tRNA synthetase